MNTLIKTGKNILNALAFSNVGNQREFNALLAKTSAQINPEMHQPASVTNGRTAITSALTHFQQAL